MGPIELQQSWCGPVTLRAIEMMSGATPFPARALSDVRDWLVVADEPLAGLQQRCGGTIPGMIAIPSLLEIVRKARHYALRLARPVSIHDGADTVSAWVEVIPRGDGVAGCEIVVRNWQSAPSPAEDPLIVQQRIAEIDRELAELTGFLDGGQRLLTVHAEAADLQPLLSAMRDGIGQPWTDFVEVENLGDSQPVHWRLLDGAFVTIPASQRRWRAHLFPQAGPGELPAGFELCLTSDEPPSEMVNPWPERAGTSGGASLLGTEIAPVLREPIARIIANAGTIRARLAGPLADDYANYAADIAGAGQHLLGLLEDLADLAAVESPDFSIAGEAIDLVAIVRQAAGLLGGPARERAIVIAVPEGAATLTAVAEPRRVLQILLNVVGNAIRYSPERTQIQITLSSDETHAQIAITDQGPGLNSAQQERVFEKFERLGRNGDGGSGLGLYISRRLARAMGGEVFVESAKDHGARFILELPRPQARSARERSELSGEPNYGEAERG